MVKGEGEGVLKLLRLGNTIFFGTKKFYTLLGVVKGEGMVEEIS